MGLFDFVARTACRAVILPVAVVADVMTLPSKAYDDKPFLTGKVLSDELKDLDETINNIKE